MGGGTWCCCKGCVVLEDNFNRSDSTNIGGAWTEVDGDSEIVSGELMIPAAGPGVVATVAGTGETDPWCKVEVVCKDMQPGKTYWAIVNYKPSPESYYAAELECQASSVAYIRAIKVVSGTRTVLDSKDITYTAGNDGNLIACRTKEGLFATSDPSVTAWDCVTDNGGRQAGLGNDSASSDVEFDNFRFQRGESNGVRCFFCECECEGHCLPDELTLTFNATGACACIDGTTITLYLDTSSDEIKWTGSGTVGSLSNCSSSDTFSFTLYCDEDPWQFYLETDDTNNATGWTPSGSVFIAFPNAVVCDPFEITFPENTNDAFTFSMTPPCPVGGCDCEFTITITE